MRIKRYELKLKSNNSKHLSNNFKLRKMEVHAHTPRKKWTHYFWEFLMLFLAVFCGFLAEYKLEHIIEHQREKQYMQSMLRDLMADTATLNLYLAF